MFERTLYKALKSHLAEKPATVITGMRRVGKSTLLKQLLDKVPGKNKIYLDLERIENRLIFKQSTNREMELFLETMGVDVTKKCTIALDEIQLLPEIVSVMKYWYDTYRTKFIVTGSSSFYLKNRFSESLAGRKQIFELTPLSFDEFLRFKGIEVDKKFSFYSYLEGFYNLYKSHYNEFIRFGGFPEVTLIGKTASKKAMLQDILNAYIDMDVKILSDYSLNDELYRLIRLLSARVGSKMDASKLASVAGINRNKIANYLNLFEQTYFLTKLTPFSNNTDKEISQQPKYYFSDSGLLNLMEEQETGKIFENTVINQFMRLNKSVNYYQKKSGQEIDLIWKENCAVEIKTTVTQSDAALLSSRSKSMGLKKQILVGLNPAGNNFKNFVWGGNVF
ncbi:MAG: ATP-binding protein [Chryseotalea sp. WA131a]|jgi:predicted AAA+ superfamily ATPase|nr:MAG: ATP-binding protein [Chryseotalea sp. WA131a]